MYRRYESQEVALFTQRLAERLREVRTGTRANAVSTHPFALSVLKDLEETTEELQVAEEELRVQNEELAEAAKAIELEGIRFQSIFDLSPDPLIITDSLGNIREANRAATRLLGVPRDRLERKPFPTYLDAASRGPFRAYLTRAARLESPGSVEIEVRGRGGGVVSMTARATQIPGAFGQYEIAWTLSPRSSFHRSSVPAELQALRDEVDRAREEARMRTRAMAAVSHEIRTPLQSILGYAQLLLSALPEPLPERPHRYVEGISSAAQHLAALVEDVLAFHREEVPLALAEVEVQHVFDECDDMVRASAAAAGLDLEFYANPGTRLWTDAAKLKQVILNLVANAVKFTAHGAVRISGSEDGDRVVIMVSDTGPGIAPEDVPHIFDPFWRGSTISRNPVEGAGLGLALVRVLVSRLGGELGLETSLGQGSTFTLWLPRIPAT
jgi:PAS domain S-box-containing protein